MNYKGCKRKLLFPDLSYCPNICVTVLKKSYKLLRSWWAVSLPRLETDTLWFQIRISTGYVNLLAVKIKICHVLHYTVLFHPVTSHLYHIKLFSPTVFSQNPSFCVVPVVSIKEEAVERGEWMSVYLLIRVPRLWLGMLCVKLSIYRLSEWRLLCWFMSGSQFSCPL